MENAATATIMPSSIAEFPDGGHDCSQCSVLTAENEIVCIRCGQVDEEATKIHLSEESNRLNEKMSGAVDHNAPNGLLNSETVQAGYVSRINPGVAFELNNPRGKDAFGKRIKKQLVDPYRAGLVADPSKGCHTEENVLTGKTALKFTKYDLSTLQLMKERTLKLCSSYQLDTVQETLISKEVKKIYSNLFLGPMLDYAAITSILKYRHFLSN